MQGTLYTIGYEGLNQEDFVSWLKRYDINVVADVRQLPLSRKKGFSKSTLSERLTNENIEYYNYRDLGANKALRTQLKETKNYTKFFKAMSLSIKTHPDQLQEISSIVDRGLNVALMCFEKNYKECHRKIVAKSVKETNSNGLKIKHIST